MRILHAIIRRTGWLALIWLVLLLVAAVATGIWWVRSLPERVFTDPVRLLAALEEPIEGAFQRKFAELKARKAPAAELEQLYIRRDRAVQRLDDSAQFVETTAKTVKSRTIREAVHLLQDKGVAAALECLAKHPLPQAKRGDEPDRESAAVLLLKGELLRNRLEFEAARTAMQEAARLDRRWTPPNCRLGAVCMDTGDWKTAESEFRTAVKFAGTDEEKAVALNSLAQVLMNTGRPAEADPLLQRAVEVAEISFGTMNPLIVPILNNRAQLLQARNQFTEAEALLKWTISVQETHYGPQHPKVAVAVTHLARFLQAASRPGEVEPLLTRALEISVAADGPNHPRVATALNNLAGLLRSDNRLIEAEPMMRRALAIYEKSYGPTHPKITAVLNNLAQLLQANERLPEAVITLKRVLAIFEESHGPEHPFVLTAIDNLVWALQAAQRLPEAEPLMRRALAINEKLHGPEHPDLALRLNNLSQLLQATHRAAEAEPLMRRGLKILFKSALATGSRHPELRTLFDNYRLALLSKAQDENATQDQLTALAQEAGFDREAGRKLVEQLR